MKRKGFIREFHEIKIYTMFNNFPFLKQNRVTKRLALLASDRIVTVKKELKKDTVDDEKLNNNIEPVKEVVKKSDLPKKQETKEDPFQLPIPGDYDDYWYFRSFYRADLPVLKRLQYLDFKTYLVDDNLTKVDRASMQCSIECRVPLLNKDLVNFVFSIKTSLIWKNSKKKYLLRKIAET